MRWDGKIESDRAGAHQQHLRSSTPSSSISLNQSPQKFPISSPIIDQSTKTSPLCNFGTSSRIDESLLKIFNDLPSNASSTNHGLNWPGSAPAAQTNPYAHPYYFAPSQTLPTQTLNWFTTQGQTPACQQAQFYHPYHHHHDHNLTNGPPYYYQYSSPANVGQHESYFSCTQNDPESVTIDETDRSDQINSLP